MIDKVELRVPGFTAYSPQFSKLYQEIRNDPNGPFRPTAHYLASADLRSYGYPAVLHTHNIHDKQGNHKLELIETGRLKYTQMRQEIQRIFDTESGPLELMRVDLAADVPGVPVSWFKQNVLGQYKRWTADIGTLDTSDAQVSSMGKTGVETFYLGKRPNVIRMYNKIAERWQEYSRRKKRALFEAKKQARGGPLNFSFPAFEALFGYPEEGLILTRVERQIAAGRVPKVLATFGHLGRAADLDPFERLVFLNGGKPEPNPDHYDFATFAQGMYIRQLIQDEGIHRAKQFLNRHSMRNANRMLRRFRDFIPDDAGRVTQKMLVNKYRDSVSKQLAA